MRSNLPVSQKEYLYDSQLTLLSATDTHSHIRYANPAFVTISGFEREELLFQPHNLVRHPDMPPEAFADMWRSLKSGKSWTGLVKNRRKNGDHYWVRANVTPMISDGVTRGYMSVRTSPGRDEVRSAERLYAKLRDGKAAKLKFHQGLIVRSGPLGRLLSLPRVLSVSWRIRLSLAAVALCGMLPALLLGAPPVLLESMAGACIVAATLVGWLLENQIARPLGRIAEQAQRVASGSRAEGVQLDRIDELGKIQRSINQAGLNLAALIDDVGARVEGLHDVASEIAEGSRELSSSTEQSSSSVVETAAAMEQLTAAVGQNAEASRKASSLADEASASAESGREMVSEVSGVMQGIADSSSQVTRIIGVIDSIAFQTNILALNASVEAARAGERGRGFAVVAGEIRNLAGRCSEASHEIRTLIEASVERVQAGSELVNRTEKMMTDIASQILNVSSLLGEITHASQEQAGGVHQVGVAIEQIDRATQQNAALAERSNASTEHLRELLQHVVDAIEIYRHAENSRAQASPAGGRRDKSTASTGVSRMQAVATG